MYVLNHLGADPELFIASAKGTPVPCVGILGGTKQNPKPVPELGDGFAVQEDNVMAEFNIPPARNAQEWVISLSRMLVYLNKYFNKQNLFLDISASKKFDPAQLLTEQALVMGCDPDYSVWDRKRNTPPNPEIAQSGLRSCGGHIHVDFSNMNGKPIDMADQELVVASMDLFLSIPSLLLDKDEQRKQLYGKAGAFRFKPYGVEYRSLSNFWLTSPKLMEWVWNNTEAAVAFAGTTKAIDIYDRHEINRVINHNDKMLAKEYIKMYKIPLPA